MVDSYAPFIFELRIRLADGTEEVIPAHEFFQSLTIDETTNAAWKGTLTLFDKLDGKGYLAGLIFATGYNSRLRMRWNWDVPSAGLARAPMYEAKILKFLPTFSHTGDTIVLEFMADAPAVAVLDKQSRQGWGGGKKASEIVAEIAASRDWIVTDDEGNSTIDTTDPPLERAISYSGESDLRLIREKLLPYTVSSDGRHYEFYFDRNNVLHFHPIDHGKRARVAQRSYTKLRDPMGEVIEFAPEDDAVYSALWGSASAEYVAADAGTGVFTQETTTSTKGGEADAITHTPDEGYVHPVAPDGQRQARIPLMTRDRNEMARMAQARYSWVTAHAVKAKLVVKGSHDLTLLSVVNIEHLTGAGTKHWLAGLYEVFSIQHEMGESAWQTTYTLGRGGVAANAPGAVKKEGAERSIELDPQPRRGVKSRQTTTTTE